MEYRFLGKSGLQVSVLSFGTMTFGGADFFKSMGSTQAEEAREMVTVCMEAGINLFDTADIYSQGLAEKVLGEAIGKDRRDKVLIATKAFGRMGPGVHDTGLSRLHLIKACEDSLKRLNTDYIDLYQVHLHDALTPMEETLNTLDQLIRAGKVRYIGCSNFSSWQAMKALGISEKYGYQPFISQQMYYSLLVRDLEHDLIPFALDQRVGTLVWSPLSFGLLAGKYRKGAPSPSNTRLATLDALGPVDWERLYRIVNALEEIAAAHEKTIPQVALNWLLRRPSVSSIILGARTMEQLKDNLGAVGWSLTSEEVRRLDIAGEVPAPYPAWQQRQFGSERNPTVVSREN